MTENAQATSTPYEAAVPVARDTGLVWSKEFGTNVTADVGDNFNTTSAPVRPPTLADIDARLFPARGSRMLRRGNQVLIPGQTIGKR